MRSSLKGSTNIIINFFTRLASNHLKIRNKTIINTHFNNSHKTALVYQYNYILTLSMVGCQYEYEYNYILLR